MLTDMLKISVLLAITMFTQVVHGQEPMKAETLFVQFQRLTLASGEFEQRKYFTVLKQPILSYGEIHVDQRLGLVWQTKVPVFSRLLLKHNNLYTDDGNSPIKLIKGGNTLANVIMHAMLGDVAALHAQFDLQNATAHNCLELRPKEQQLAKVIRLIRLCGSDRQNGDAVENPALESIVLYEHSGNRTEIDLKLTQQNSLPEAIHAQLQ